MEATTILTRGGVVRPKRNKASPTRARKAGSGTGVGCTSGTVELVNETLICPDGPPFWVFDAEKNDRIFKRPFSLACGARTRPSTRVCRSLKVAQDG